MVTRVVLVLLQAGGWTVTPTQPTVGDTVRLEHYVPAPPGWRVRAAQLEPQPLLEPLADPEVLRARGGWVVRYGSVAWAPGSYRHPMPPLLLLGPDGQVDSLPGDTAVFELRSVIGDSVTAAAPQPALPPLRPAHRDPLPVTLAIVAALGVLLAGVAWQRRAPRRMAEPPDVPVNPEVPDGRWLAAGEPRAVAARAAGQLRAAVARAIPAAHSALSTPECLAVLEGERPDAPLRDLEVVLQALDQIAFATVHGVDVGELAARARTLAREFAP
ncbi:MAG: hypothetical protein HYS40_04265 [Gemmatimonadetes bacterium]|nr:hypothetical protein [Gemmatimonadota bacterium]